MSWARRAAALLASGTLLGAGCGGRERERVVIQDLATLALAASYEGPLEHVVFTLPGAARTGLEGLVQPLEPHDEPGVWLRPSATLRLGGTPGAARRIVVELEPHPGSERLALLALWNDRKAGRFALEAGRRRYVIDAPRTAAAAENRLTLRFHGAATRLPVYRGRLAARIFALWAGRAGEESLAPERAGGDPPVSVRSQRDSRDIVLAPGALRFALVLPQRSELRFSPRLLAGNAASLRVTIGTRSGEERELWRGQPGGEAVVPLAAADGQRAWLTLHVDAADLATRVAFMAPRLLGEPADPPPPPHSEQDEARADALRSALRGANVMLVILDSAGARHLGPWGGPAQASPEIQRLASEGVVFENAFTPAVYTLPAMSSIFTSLDPDEHGNLDPWTGHLSRAPLVLAEVAAARGIHTAAFVANGMVGRVRGFERGFSEFHELYESPSDLPDAERFRPLLDRFLAASGERRFFAWVHFLEPHFPYDPQPPFDTLFGGGPLPKELRSEPGLLLALDLHRRRALPDEIDHLRRLYLGKLAYVDREVGRLRRRLEETGLLEKTVLIVAADHGEAFREHGHNGHEVQVYDELAHVPLLIRFPKAAGLAGRRIAPLVELRDLAPTIADVLGFWRADRVHLEGLSLLPVAAGAPGRREVVTRDRGEAPRYAQRSATTTCILNTGGDSVEIYDRLRDPGETKDLAGEDALRADVCRQSIRAWVLDRRLRAAAATPPRVSDEDRERLKALGYVQ